MHEHSKTYFRFHCRAFLFGIVVLELQLHGADAPHAKPRSGGEPCMVTFPSFIDVSACAGFQLKWSSQELEVDPTTGNFNTTWSPTQPNVLNVSGHLDATTFSANLTCPTNTGITGTMTASGSNNSYTGTYTLSGVTGPINVVLTPNTGSNGFPTVNAALAPDPAAVGQTVTFKGTVTLPAGQKFTANDMGTLSFGDGSPSITMTAQQFLPIFNSPGVTHVFQSAGVFDVSLYLFDASDPTQGMTYDFFEVVGAASIALNASTGASVTAQVNGGGTVVLQIDATQIVGASTALSVFEDHTGTVVPAPNGPLQGFDVGQTIGASGLFVATTQIVDASNATLTTLRKTSGISEKLAGVPNALNDPPSTAITVKSMKGKFTFNLSHPDDVAFSGQFMLPPGFTFSRSDADIVEFSIGNVVDTVQLNAKGSALTGSRGRIKNVSVKIPKLKTGVALGGEIAKITLSYDATNLTGDGFDTEGIVALPGANETGVKTLTRFIQVNMIFAGVAYESLVSVGYVISSNGDFGTIAGRN